MKEKKYYLLKLNDGIELFDLLCLQRKNPFKLLNKEGNPSYVEIYTGKVIRPISKNQNNKGLTYSKKPIQIDKEEATRHMLEIQLVGPMAYIEYIMRTNKEIKNGSNGTISLAKKKTPIYK